MDKTSTIEKLISLAFPIAVAYVLISGLIKEDRRLKNLRKREMRRYNR